MGSDNIACSGTVIKYADLKKICPREINNIDVFLDEHDEVCWTDIGSCGDEGDFDFEGSDQLVKLIKKLKDKFEEETTVGESYLTLSFCFYDDEDGSIYDAEEFAHNGCIFIVDGHSKPTEAGVKFRKVLSHQTWSQWG